MENFIIKFSEEHVRIFEHENVFIVSEADVNAVANFYGINIFEAYDKICESHKLNEDSLMILCESYDDQAVSALERKRAQYESQLRVLEAKKEERSNRYNIVKNEIEKIDKALKEKKAD